MGSGVGAVAAAAALLEAAIQGGIWLREPLDGFVC
jgi:hypothetical protein